MRNKLGHFLPGDEWKGIGLQKAVDQWLADEHRERVRNACKAILEKQNNKEDTIKNID